MCRFTYYQGAPVVLADLITEPAHSLIHQSFHSTEREEPLNGDGFGLAWYVEGTDEPALFRSVTPAWSNRNLRELARVTSSACVLAHIRAATQVLEVTETNCHPFKSGRYTFMHNGDVGGFTRIRRRLLRTLGDAAFHSITGSTDSEHLFAVFLDELDRAGPAANGGRLAFLTECLERAIDRVLDMAAEHAPEEASYLNLVLCDGASAVACRYSTAGPGTAESLYVARGTYACEGGEARIEETDGEGIAVIVSSERLSDDGCWHPAPAGQWVMISPEMEVTYREMRVGPDFDLPPRETNGAP